VTESPHFENLTAKSVAGLHEEISKGAAGGLDCSGITDTGASFNSESSRLAGYLQVQKSWMA
jgi:hypothetical protein